MKMKKISIVISIMVLAVVLSACGSGGETAKTSEPSAADIYTSVAQTVVAQITSAKAKDTPVPEKSTDTPEPIAAPQTENTEAPAEAQPGPTSTTICDNSAFLSDVTIPDGTVLAPGQTFTKTWKMQNSGACAWTKDYTIARLSGSSMDGEPTNLKALVDIWKKADISVDLVAPTKNGTYTGYWKLKNASGAWFGTSVYVKIVVSGDAKTTTPTPEDNSETTATPTKTPKHTKTPTPE
jgi:hypothetical protein